MSQSNARALLAEALGSALLLAVVAGSGIMAMRLAGGNIALALLANAIATGCGLVVLIMLFGPLSGAHFNPMVSLYFAWRGELAPRLLPGYIVAQCAGAVLGIAAAHAMFDLPLISSGVQVRSGGGLWFAEVVASFGLLLCIIGLKRNRPEAIPYAVGLYICAAYWFTASTSFANPAATLARAFTDTFVNIRLLDVPAFMLAQLAGGALAALLGTWLFGKE
ncbi:MIP/aquaporin family protein [Massilia sp. W12]|uniref:MIP/aquaporin family protein n=1 Tax=Massilia sp. W12 TaxID=3126507 RepID=UPI0030CFB344